MYFRRIIVSLKLCKEYLNIATFKILGLLLIEMNIFDITERLCVIKYKSYTL